MGGRLRVRITPGDVGKRVSVRSLTPPEVSDARFTDTVGVLTAWHAGVLWITRRNGERVCVAEDTLVAGKVVPAAPARRSATRPADVAELARTAARAWPAVAEEPLGAWLLRAASGFTRRANSALAVGDPGLPLDAALERVRAWYAARDLPALVQLPVAGAGVDDRLPAALDARGWRVESVAELWVGELATVAAAPDAGPGGDVDVTLSRTVGADWLAGCHRFADRSPTAPELAVLRGGPSVWFATVPGEGGPGAPATAVGRCVVDGDWAGFTVVEVARRRRRRGLATAVLAALARQARAEGARAAYLEVEADNEPARALYRRLGFTQRFTYHHRGAPDR